MKDVLTIYNDKLLAAYLNGEPMPILDFTKIEIGDLDPSSPKVTVELWGKGDLNPESHLLFRSAMKNTEMLVNWND